MCLLLPMRDGGRCCCVRWCATSVVLLVMRSVDVFVGMIYGILERPGLLCDIDI